MAIVVDHEDVRGTRMGRVRDDGRVSTRTEFIYPPEHEADRPQAYLIEESPGRHLRAHYHQQDQFQLFLSGTGTVGRHRIQPIQVHFARKHTPYGPLIASGEGYSYMTLRNRRDPGAQLLPEKRAALDAIAHRRPWQHTAEVRFAPATDGMVLQPIEGMRADDGLDACTILMAPRHKAAGPDASGGAGQYIVVFEGSFVYQGKEHGPSSMVYVAPSEGHFVLEAGPAGLKAVALTFPREAAAAAAAPAAGQGGDFKVWQCALCAFIYDEAAGLPEEGIAPGTRWADVPDRFGCPDCSAVKADFRMMEL